MGLLVDLNDVPPRRIWKGVVGRLIEGEQMTVAVIELEPGTVVPPHQHDNEQIGVVVEGSATFTIAGETAELTAGGTYRIPSQALHDVVVGPAGAIFAEAFAPPRQDWAELACLAASSPLWPRP